jgi:hypothetical protein
MAFLFPADKATFTAPNGITYAWKDDHWVVQKFKGDSEVEVGPNPPSNPSEGKLWYDSSADVIELFIYVDGNWVSATPNSEYALESRIAVNEQGIRDLWSDQNRQDFEVAAIDTRVDALEGVVGQFQYIIQTANVTPRDGQLAFLKQDMSATTRWADAFNIAVNPTDKNGNTWATDEIVTGDVLRFHLKGDITMEVSAFEAKVIQNNNNLFSIDQVVKEVGTILDGSEYEVYHLSSFDPSGLATMDYVDAQDQNLKNYTDSELADLQKYVDEKVSDSTADLDSKVSKAGDAMANNAYLEFPGGGISYTKDGAKQAYLYSANDSIVQWTAYNGNQIKITARDGDPGGGRTYVDIKTAASSGAQGEDTGYRMRLYHVADPTSEFDGANKRYVDQQVQENGGIVPGFTRPPGLKFMFESGNGTPSNGKFKFYSDSGQSRVKISSVSQDFDWGTDSPTGDISYSESHLFHIWAIASSTGNWKVKCAGSFNRMDWHANDILLYVPYHLKTGTWSETASYYITIAGLF